MAQSGKGKLNYRCPRCFMRDIDVDMFYDGEKEEYYCLRCCFRGKEKEVLELNEQIKGKYVRLRERVVTFGEDNEAPVFMAHKSGEQ